MSFGRNSRSQERLARVTAGVSPPKSVHEQARERFDAEIDDTGDSLSAGFIAGTIALVLVAFVGMYFIFGGSARQRGALVSSVDRTCGEGWEKDQSNVDQLHCYLTTNVSRLCDPSERRHLAATIDRFDRDYVVWKGRMFGVAMATVAKMKVNGPQIGLQMGKISKSLNDPNVSDDEIEGMMANVVPSIPDSVKSQKVNSISFYKLEEEFARLAAKGYMTEQDFGWGKPIWVSNGLKVAKSVKPVCSG